MIIAEFNNGWGGDWPVKQFEQEIVSQVLSTDHRRTVIINSTWYTNAYHQEVLQRLKNINFDHLVIVAMLDPAIPKLDWYQDFGCTVTGIGYYPESFNIDFWALVLDKFYQDSNIELLDSNNIDIAYMCLNRKPHWHRKKLYSKLEQNNLLNQGLVSMGGTRYLEQDVGYQDLTPNSGPGEYGISNDIVSLGRLDNWNRCFFNLVTETSWDINHTGFVSEKIYKPIIGCRPFLVYDPDSGVNWLNSRGFQTYTQDFQDITDLTLTDPNNHVAFLKVLCEQPKSYWQKKFVDLKEKLLYNKSHFADYVKQQQLNIKQGISCQI